MLWMREVGPGGHCTNASNAARDCIMEFMIATDGFAEKQMGDRRWRGSSLANYPLIYSQDGKSYLI